MKKVSLILLVGLLVLLISSMVLANLNEFKGQWVNTDPNTQGITALNIGVIGNQVSVRAWGKAHPKDIDWGSVPGYPYTKSVSDNINGAKIISATFRTSFSEIILLIQARGNQLGVDTFTRFTDNSGRSNYYATYYFKQDNGNQSQGVLPAPIQIAPANGKVFNNYPRHTRLMWRPVQGAQSYTVQVDYFDSDWVSNRGQTYILAPNIRQTGFTFEFVGAQPGRWRVWAVDAQGQPGQKSPWWEFKYTK